MKALSVIVLLFVSSISHAQKRFSEGTFHVKKDTSKIDAVTFTLRYRNVVGQDSEMRFISVDPDGNAYIYWGIVDTIWREFSEDRNVIKEVNETITLGLISDINNHCPNWGCTQGKYYYEICVFINNLCDNEVIVGEEALNKYPKEFLKVRRLITILDEEYKKYSSTK